jgi:TPR repeat protein
MKSYKVVTLLALLCVCQAVAGQAASDEPINLNQSLVLTPQQRLSLAVEAMRGSSDAATRISLFYGFVLLNPMEERRWALIAAENGDPVAQYNVYEDFMNNDTALDTERALFWLRKSAASGFKEAKDKLEHVERTAHHTK